MTQDHARIRAEDQLRELLTSLDAQGDVLYDKLKAMNDDIAQRLVDREELMTQYNQIIGRRADIAEELNASLLGSYLL